MNRIVFSLIAAFFEPGDSLALSLCRAALGEIDTSRRLFFGQVELPRNRGVGAA
jgi:hypothetical protein